VVVPAFEAARTVGGVVAVLAGALSCAPTEVFVVDDGSADDTWGVACRAGARAVRCALHGGKGAALLRGLEEARAAGFGVALTVDADGQHPGDAARAVLRATDDPGDLVLGVRDLRREGAPRLNRFSNGVSNLFLSRFAGKRLLDSQCGLRRYPVAATLALGTRAPGFAFEAEVLLRAVAGGLSVVHAPVRVVYPPGRQRTTHFDSVRDPVRIIFTVLGTRRALRCGS
jgi:glycosyltransferase involved in cell wall biosynthesis